MAFSNIDSLRMGSLLQIIFSRGVRVQISKAHREWEQVKQMKVGSSLARELRFELQKNFGPAAVQYRDPGTTDRAFPTAQQSTLEEFTAKFKELEATIEVEYNLYKRALETPEKYGSPLAIELQSKTIALRRRIAADFYEEGLGVIGTALSASDTAGANGYTAVTLKTTNTARGHIGLFEFGDLLLNKNPAGTADDPTVTGTFYAWRVKKKDRKNNIVYLEAVNSAGTVLALTASSIDADDVFYRIGQTTIPDLTGSIADYGLATQVFAGLESLAAADARVVHGITMDGAYAGSRIGCGGDVIDARHIQEALDNVKVNVGEDAYSYKKMCMAPEVHAALINSRETDRRFVSVEDKTRGVRYFAYQHGNDSVEAYTSEFVRKNRIWGLPESSEGEKVLEAHMSDFKPVKLPGGSEFMLKPSASGGYSNMVVSYVNGVYLLVCKHPAAIWSLDDFVLSA